MFGPPKSLEGNCNAKLELGDDYGDNMCTCLCTLELVHTGLHTEQSRDGQLTITWTDNQSVKE